MSSTLRHIIGVQPVKLWKLSDAETTVRKREGRWSKKMRYLDWVH